MGSDCSDSVSGEGFAGRFSNWGLGKVCGDTIAMKIFKTGKIMWNRNVSCVRYLGFTVKQ